MQLAEATEHAPAPAIRTRLVVRCRSCDLNQFMPAENRCRRCSARLSVSDLEGSLPDFPRQRYLFWGQLVTELRRRRGYSQGQLAQRMRVPRTYISKLERRLKPATIAAILRLAHALNIEPDELIADADTARFHYVRRLLADPFMAELAAAAHGLSADSLTVVLLMARSLARGQRTFEEWVQL